MNGFNAYTLLKGMAEKWISAQEIHPGDTYDSDGLLICGRCGEHRQMIDLVANPSGSNPDRKTPVKFTVMCKCEREAEEKRKLEEQAREDLERIASLRSASLMDQRFAEATFDRFEVSRANERNLKLCKRYVDRFDLMLEKNQGLLLWGGVGTGKTFAAACIANALLQRKIPVMMTSFVKLLSIIQSGEERDSRILDRMGRAKLVIFDDLGAERGTEYALEKVFSIVDARYGQKLPSIFTTNLTLKEMKDESEIRLTRIYDRIFSNCYPVQFTGPSWRKREAGLRYEEMERLLGE